MVYMKIITKFYLIINAYAFTLNYILGRIRLKNILNLLDLNVLYFKSLRLCFRLYESMKNYINNCENERLVFEKEEIRSKRYIPIIGKLFKNVISGI